jgi:hypothetical protein
MAGSGESYIEGIEFRWVNPSGIDAASGDAFSGSFATFSDDNLLGVSYVPIKLEKPGLAAEFEILGRVVGKLEDEGYDVQLVRGGTSWPMGEVAGPGPTAFLLPVPPHVLERLGHAIIQIIHRAEPATEAITGISEAITATEKVVETIADLQNQVEKPKKGGTVEGATAAAKKSLTEMLGMSPDTAGCQIEAAELSKPPGTYLVTIVAAKQSYRSTIIHVGKCRYQLARMVRLAPPSST